MDLVVARIQCRGLTNFEGESLSIDFVTSKRAYASEVDEGVVEHLFGSVYKLNVVALTGINASGKTTVLTILAELMGVLLGNKSLSQQMRIAHYFSDALEVEAYFFKKSSKTLYKLVSRIQKGVFGTLRFSDETLWSKSVGKKMTRLTLFDFAGEPSIERSAVSSSFLKREDSIFSSILNACDNCGETVLDLRETTNRNLLSVLNFGLMLPFVRYLDSSVEDFRLNEEASNSSGSIVFSVRFKGSTTPISARVEDLDLYLSSGTIKGLNCLSAIAGAFSTGGYVLVDEVENHLNKTIVINLMRLFTSKTNANGATLVFSTHYSEILDSVDRSDGIYLFDKKEGLSVRKFSDAAEGHDRRDKRRSDLILSGVLNSAPSYRAYHDMITALEEWLRSGGKDD